MLRAWVAGGTGLVGGELLRALLADSAFGAVIAVGRRPVPTQHARLEQRQVDFRAASSFASLPGCDVAFSCLGTTIKKAGSQEAFRAVDYDAVLAFARAAREKGALTFLHVSSLGADARSRTFYSRVKGEVEEAVARIDFDSVYALRPSILDGDRAESRPLERIGLVVGRALGPVLGSLRPTRASDVAAAMIARAKAPSPGAHVATAKEITALAAP